MDDSGVTRDTAIRALKAKKVDISFGSDGLVTLIGKDSSGFQNEETVRIPDELGRRFVDRLSRLFDVPIHWFYNPLMIPGEEEQSKPS